MSTPPLTRLTISAEEEAMIRQRVRAADPAELGADYVLADAAHVDALVEFLSDPRLSDPIFDLPRPFTPANVAAWIAAGAAIRRCGEGMLAVAVDPDGRIRSFSHFTVWPQWSAAEIIGGHRADDQDHGRGTAGAARSFGWMFDRLGVRLICVTAAIDNVRSHRVIEAAGFIAMGERETRRPDGETRRSRYWEMTREQWQSRHRSQP